MTPELGSRNSWAFQPQDNPISVVAGRLELVGFCLVYILEVKKSRNGED